MARQRPNGCLQRQVWPTNSYHDPAEWLFFVALSIYMGDYAVLNCVLSALLLSEYVVIEYYYNPWPLPTTSHTLWLVSWIAANDSNKPGC